MAKVISVTSSRTTESVDVVELVNNLLEDIDADSNHSVASTVYGSFNNVTSDPEEVDDLKAQVMARLDVMKRKVQILSTLLHGL